MDDPIHHTRMISTGLLICISIMFGATVAAANLINPKFACSFQEVGR